MAKFADLIETAINNPSLDGALAPLMDFLGITDGGVAGIYFLDGGEESWPTLAPIERKFALREWIGMEIMWMGTV
jgi:hypothetical protein